MLKGYCHCSWGPSGDSRTWNLHRGKHDVDTVCQVAERYVEHLVTPLDPQGRRQATMFFQSRHYILHLCFRHPAISFVLYGPEDRCYSGYVPLHFVFDLLQRIGSGNPVEDLVDPHAVVADSYELSEASQIYLRSLGVDFLGESQAEPS